MRSTSLGVVKAGNLKLDFMAESIVIHFFEFEDKFRCYRDNENLKKHFGHMDTLNTKTIQVRNRNKCKNKNKNIKNLWKELLWKLPFYEGLNGVNRQPSNCQKINRLPSITEYFYRQPSNERAKISRQISQISLNDQYQLT